MTTANVVDSSGWLEYFADSERADIFAPAIEDATNLLVPVISIYTSNKTPKSAKATPCPTPDTLKIDGNWQDAVKKAFTKKKPAGGCPK